MEDSQQYIFPLFDKPLYLLDNFINSPSNHSAYCVINNWQIAWGIKPYQLSLLIYGPSSSGKTYLTKIWQNLSNAFVVSKDLQEISNELISKHAAFIIEDIEELEEETILHYFNLINECGKYLLMTTGRFINNFVLPDLTSRINSLMKIEIKQPDDELMSKLIFKHFSEHAIIVNDQIINYLLINLPRQFNQMTILLAKITQFALVAQQPVTLSLIKKALK